MNFLLSLNKTYILYLLILISIIFISFIFFQYFLFLDKKNIPKNNFISNVDITEPRFSINNSEHKILVTAEEGNFLDKDKILLNKNVLFKSNSFSIQTDKVIFNRKKQTANSETKSIFRSKNTKIFSEGFDIYDNGNRIKFFGNAVIILK